MDVVRLLCRAGRWGVAAALLLLVGCAKPSMVDDHLESGGTPAVEFSVDEGGRHWPSGSFQPEALDWYFGRPGFIRE